MGTENGRRGAAPALGEGSRVSGDLFGDSLQRLGWACSLSLARGWGPVTYRTTTAALLADYCSLVLSEPVPVELVIAAAAAWGVEVYIARFWTRGIFGDRTDRCPVLLLRDGDLVKAGRHSVENDIYAQEHGRFPGPFAGQAFVDYHNHNNALRDSALGRLLAEPTDPYPRRIPARPAHAGRRTRPRTRAT